LVDVEASGCPIPGEEVGGIVIEDEAMVEAELDDAAGMSISGSGATGCCEVAGGVDRG
jgi:hypothetical protein